MYTYYTYLRVVRTGSRIIIIRVQGVSETRVRVVGVVVSDFSRRNVNEKLLSDPKAVSYIRIKCRTYHGHFSKKNHFVFDVRSKRMLMASL